MQNFKKKDKEKLSRNGHLAVNTGLKCGDDDYLKTYIVDSYGKLRPASNNVHVDYLRQYLYP
jgi:hypothetical protein